LRLPSLWKEAGRRSSVRAESFKREERIVVMGEMGGARLVPAPGRDRVPGPGFTLPEVVVSLLLFSLAVLGVASTTTRLARVAGDAEIRASALDVVESRISEVRLYPDYEEMDSVFSESNVPVPGLPGFHRSTALSRVIQPGKGEGKIVDFTRITVTVSGPGLREEVSRTLAVSRP
jgi:prepilin-type N-terminal cleavage/methylation domain-containing protein